MFSLLKRNTCCTAVASASFPKHLVVPQSNNRYSGPCHPNPCHNRGTCEISETYRGDTFIGYVCKCPPGFSGVHCQHNINECERDPCKNGGICTDLVANYSCECPGEYMGRNCQYSKGQRAKARGLAASAALTDDWQAARYERPFAAARRFEAVTKLLDFGDDAVQKWQQRLLGRKPKASGY
ncbi:EGF-like repeat and discoidin I-like domain-containing protein 3 [Liparis tanakae]|uniref:EGF-like repeat and discoidin I-like domain-containing protein 3 n=1 Tax=Liparis tanakae TaxID=230148 RepID=A0A4Z2I902_9TELE|nr:EGF-like repeat and discoidin I-like domain-containing protein 3 [Liparis tanakae]